MTAPYLPDTDTLLRNSLAQVVRVSAVHPTLGTLNLDPLPGSRLSWDETRAPRVVADIITTPSQAATDLLDPLAGTRIRIAAGYIRPGGGEDVHLIADLGLRTVTDTVDAAGEAITLTAASDEALVIDASPTAGETLTAPTTAAALQSILAASMSPTPPLTIREAGPPVDVTPVTDRWDTLRDRLELAGLTAYDTGLRHWVIEPRPDLATESVATLTTGPTGTATATATHRDRAQWHNHVCYRYAWRDSAGAEQLVTATALITTGPYRVDGPAGKRSRVEVRATPTTQADANAAAADVLSRALGRAHAFTATAVAAWWVRPGHTVTVRTRRSPAARHIVQDVTFDLAGKAMTLRTRVPATGTITTTTASPTPTPEPAPPAAATFVTEWTANGSATYRGDGTRRTDTPDAVTGYSPYAPSNGNQHALITFTAATSTGGETGKTIPQALAGATVQLVELHLTSLHSHYPAGTVRIGHWAGDTLPAAHAAGSPTETITGWPRGAGRWVDITDDISASALAAGLGGIVLGPGLGGDPTYYVRLAGATSPTPPRLRVTYTRPT